MRPSRAGMGAGKQLVVHGAVPVALEAAELRDLLPAPAALAIPPFCAGTVAQPAPGCVSMPGAARKPPWPGVSSSCKPELASHRRPLALEVPGVLVPAQGAARWGTRDVFVHVKQLPAHWQRAGSGRRE